MTNTRARRTYHNAECYFFMNDMDQAAGAYKSFYINYPKDKMVPQAMFQVGVSFFQKKDFKKAAEAFDEFVRRHPQDSRAKDAAINVALCYKKAFRLMRRSRPTRTTSCSTPMTPNPLSSASRLARSRRPKASSKKRLLTTNPFRRAPPNALKRSSVSARPIKTCTRTRRLRPHGRSSSPSVLGTTNFALLGF